MTKWICNKCMAGNPCSLDFIGTSTIPKICPFMGTDIAEWRTEQKQKQETELPDDMPIGGNAGGKLKKDLDNDTRCGCVWWRV